MQAFRGFVVGQFCSFRRLKAPEIKLPVSVSNLSNEFTGSFMPINPLYPELICAVRPAISYVSGSGTGTKVLASIVQRIQVLMIALFGLWDVQDFAMHVNQAPRLRF